jgi:hypothetical protein
MKAIDKERPIRRRIIREWMALSADKRQTVEQVKDFAERVASQHQFARSCRDPGHKITGWLLPRLGRQRWNEPRNG